MKSHPKLENASYKYFSIFLVQQILWRGQKLFLSGITRDCLRSNKPLDLNCLAQEEWLLPHEQFEVGDQVVAAYPMRQHHPSPSVAVPAETPSASQPASRIRWRKQRSPGLAWVLWLSCQQFPGTVPRRLTAAHTGRQLALPATQLKNPLHATCDSVKSKIVSPHLRYQQNEESSSNATYSQGV